MRAGVIEALNCRLSTLEHMFLGQGLLLKPLLERALLESNNDISISEPTLNQLSLEAQVEKLKTSYIETTELASSQSVTKPHDNNRDNSPPLQSPPSCSETQQHGSLTDPAPLPKNVVDSLVDWYFIHIHPWIPILHVKQFREELETSNRPNLNIVLYAIISLCLRFKPTTSLSHTEKRDISLQCRHAVILQSMGKFSVASLQALVIIAFDIIGTGRGPSAWSVIGSMTRTVEQLRLSVEDGDDETKKDTHHHFIRRMTFLRQPNSWIEDEERRRVFWSVFLMDRFCSVATGWNNSLTEADVRRRLPCEGAIWEAGTPVKTPFFGIAESPTPPHQGLTPTSERHPAGEEEVESIGGFAFCVEATESLNLVTIFFLQQAIDFTDPQGIQIWLMRFKELDLRLVKWRLFLPSKWRNASVLNQDGIMDPNLTLAHITHNTAVIQLHQCVAYPSPHWRACPVSLPSINSSETCITAACEIGTIAQQYLQLSPGITNPQFSFCLFIAGRVLLTHSRYYGLKLHPAFDIIILSLNKIAHSWKGLQDPTRLSNLSAELPIHDQVDEKFGEEEENLASKFSTRLQQAHKGVESKSLNVRDLDIRLPVYSSEIDRSRAGSTTPIVHDHMPMTEQYIDERMGRMDNGQTSYSPDSISLAFPPLPVSFEGFRDPADLLADQNGFDITSKSAPDGNLGNVPNQQGHSIFNVDLDGLFDDQYQQMLRVSTFSGDHQTQ